MSSHKRRGFTPIESVLAKAAPHRDWKENLLRYRLWEKWPDVVGHSIAAHTAPHRWMGKMLVIGVRSSAWMQELSMLKQELLKKIRDASPNLFIKDIRFELAPITTEWESREEKVVLAPLTAEQQALVEATAGEVEDEETREAIQRAMSRALQRNR